MSADIESAIADEDWDLARRLIEQRLERQPDGHWLLTRLGLTYYEQFDYETSLRYTKAALEIMPTCPLALWDYAGSLDMLKRFSEAIPVFQQLICTGDQSLAYGDCGEGIEWARALIADCYFRIAGCYRKSGTHALAADHYREYLRLRKEGWGSIYESSDAEGHLAEIER